MRGEVNLLAGHARVQEPRARRPRWATGPSAGGGEDVHKNRPVEWRIPTFFALLKLITHPIYAGVYVYGRHRMRVELVGGRLVKRREDPVAPEAARVFIPDHHEAYITWEQYKANQARIGEARPRWSMQQNQGAIRDGLALLTGVLRCGHCGGLVRVAYKRESAHYYCNGGLPDGSQRCLSFGSKAIDHTVSEQLCEVLKPHAVAAAVQAFDIDIKERSQATEQARLAVQAAKYEADRALEQYDLVDPRNRLVAANLEARLNDRLESLQSAKAHLETCEKACVPLSPEQVDRLHKLSQDFPSAWNDPNAPFGLKKRILRAVVREIIVSSPQPSTLKAVIHWQGGCHTEILVPKRVRQPGSKADAKLVDLVRLLAQTLDDVQITRILNLKKLTTPRGLRWSMDRVVAFRKQHAISMGGQVQDDGVLSSDQAAALLGISRNGIVGLAREGYLTIHQVTDYAPCRLLRAEVESEETRKAVEMIKKTGHVPPRRGCPDQQVALFPGSTVSVRKGAL